MDSATRVRQALAERMLIEAYEFIVDGWCQNASAVDECRRPIEPASAFARAWSAHGALERAWRRSPEPPDIALGAYELARTALATVLEDSPDAWNDHEGRHRSEVLDGFAEAVALFSPAPDFVEDLGPGGLPSGSEADGAVSLRGEMSREH